MAGDADLRVLWLYHRHFAYRADRDDFERPQAGSRLVLRPVRRATGRAMRTRAGARGAARESSLQLGEAFSVRVEQLRLQPHMPVGVVVVRLSPGAP